MPKKKEYQIFVGEGYFVCANKKAVKAILSKMEREFKKEFFYLKTGLFQTLAVISAHLKSEEYLFLEQVIQTLSRVRTIPPTAYQKLHTLQRVNSFIMAFYRKVIEKIDNPAYHRERLYLEGQLTLLKTKQNLFFNPNYHETTPGTIYTTQRRPEKRPVRRKV